MGNWRAFLLRQLFGRLRIGEDILRHLSTFQRLGETFEIEPPGEMLPVGMRTVLRAVRTRGAVQIRPDWLWPYWIERQTDPGSRAFVPRGHLPFLSNITHRNWTMVGNPGSPWEPIVDPRGLVTPWFDGWSLDWWVAADGGWRYPSREPEVGQELVDAMPVVRTVLPLPDGAAVQLVYAVREEREHVVVEVRNDTPRPLDVAFALRPYNPEGLAVVERLEVRGRTVLVDGRPAVVLPGTPDRTVLSTFRGPDAAHLLADGGRGGGDRVQDPAGLAQAAFAYRVPARGAVRAAVPWVRRPVAEAGIRRWARRAAPAAPREPGVRVESLPSAEDEAAGWRRRIGRGLRVTLPDERLQRAAEANEAYMLLFADGPSITPGPFTYHRFWFRDAAYQLLAMDRWGLHEEAARVLASYPRRQRADGFFSSQWREWDSNGAALFAMAEHHRLAGDDDLLADLEPAVRRGVTWIHRQLKEARDRPGPVRGLLPPGVSAEHLGPFDYYYWDDFWTWRGLLDAAHVFRSTGDRKAERGAAVLAKRLAADVMRSVAASVRRVGTPAIPAGPNRGIDAAMVSSLASCAPLGLLEADHPLIQGTLRILRDRFCVGEAFYHGVSHTGLGTYLTLQLAMVELEGGDPRAWSRLRWFLEAATPTFTWPEAIHPRLRGGCMGDGHHGWAAAELLSFVRNALVREARDGSIALLSLMPEDWTGREVRVERAPTHHGLVSFALTWDGERPHLAWECDGGAVRFTAPGVDPSWSTTEQAGEALLAPYREEDLPRRRSRLRSQ